MTGLLAVSVDSQGEQSEALVDHVCDVVLDGEPVDPKEAPSRYAHPRSPC